MAMKSPSGSVTRNTLPSLPVEMGKSTVSMTLGLHELVDGHHGASVEHLVQDLAGIVLGVLGASQAQRFDLMFQLRKVLVRSGHVSLLPQNMFSKALGRTRLRARMEASVLV